VIAASETVTVIETEAEAGIETETGMEGVVAADNEDASMRIAMMLATIPTMTISVNVNVIDFNLNEPYVVRNVK
jgi:hypothetical protein